MLNEQPNHAIEMLEQAINIAKISKSDRIESFLKKLGEMRAQVAIGTDK